MYPDLGRASCGQLTFGADIRLTPAQVGAIRDTVLAMFPAATIPWYFRELYLAGDSTYEIAASVSASNREDPSKPYNVFLRIITASEQGFEAPTITELFAMLESKDASNVYCSANFSFQADNRSFIYSPKQRLHSDERGRVDLESYVAAIYDDSDVRVGTANVVQLGDGVQVCTVSFSYIGVIGHELPNKLLVRAVELFERVQHQHGEVQNAADAG